MRPLSRRIAGWCTVACLLLAGLSAVPAPTPALAAGGNPILNDCQVNGRLTHNYSVAQLQHALAQMPTALKQYGDCYDVLQTAIIRARKGEKITSVNDGGGSFLPTPVIIILAVLIVCAVLFTGLALRARRQEPPGPPQGPPS